MNARLYLAKARRQRNSKRGNGLGKRNAWKGTYLERSRDPALSGAMELEAALDEMNLPNEIRTVREILAQYDLELSVDPRDETQT